MFNSPAGGRSGELFPSPAKGHTNEGLSGEQSSDAQTLINSALSGYYPRGTVDTLLAGKQPTITEGGLAQSKVTNLVADLGAKALQADLVSGLAGKEPTIAEGSLSQSKVTNLVADLGAKALQADLVSGLAGKEPTISEGGLAQSKVRNLTSDLAAKASTQQLADGLAQKHPLLNASSNLVVDTLSSRLYLGDVFRFWTTDQTTSLLTIANNALGAEFSMTVRAPSLLLGSYCGIGTTTPQAALDVVGSILCSAGLQAGNIDVIERLLEHGTALAGKEPTISEGGLLQSKVAGLPSDLASKQPLLSTLPGNGVDLLHTESAMARHRSGRDRSQHSRGFERPRSILPAQGLRG